MAASAIFLGQRPSGYCLQIALYSDRLHGENQHAGRKQSKHGSITIFVDQGHETNKPEKGNHTDLTQSSCSKKKSSSRMYNSEAHDLLLLARKDCKAQHPIRPSL